MKGIDFNFFKDKFTIAINHTIELFDDVNILLFGDKVFLNKTTYDVRTFNGDIFTAIHARDCEKLRDIQDDPNVYFFEPRKDQPYNNFKKGLYHPTSSGALALNLAIQMRAKAIYLYGYDFYYDNGLTHFYGNIYPHHVQYEEERVNKKALKFKAFNQFKVPIFNMSPKSRIESFPKLHWSVLNDMVCNPST